MRGRLADTLLGELVKLPLRAGAVDRSAWPIAAPLARVAELLRVDLAAVTEAARVAPTNFAFVQLKRLRGHPLWLSP